MKPLRDRMENSMRHLLAGCIFVFASLMQDAMAQPAPAARSEIVFGFPEFPPLSFANDRGEADGYLVHLTQAMFQRAGLRTRSSIFPAQRLFENLANGSIDFSMVVRNPVLDRCCLYSKKVVFREELRVYHAAGKPPVISKKALAGKHIITIQGFSYAGLIKFIQDSNNHIVSEIAPTHAAAFTMLDAGRADYVLDYAGPAANGLLLYPMRNLQSEVIDHLDIYLVLSRKFPNAEQLLPRLSAIVTELQNEPRFHLPRQALPAGQ